MQDRIKVVIVDDEPQSIHRLQDDLATLEDFEVIATFLFGGIGKESGDEHTARCAVHRC